MGQIVRQRIEPLGFNIDLPPNVVPPNVYTVVVNAVMRDGVSTKALGWIDTLGTPLFRPHWLQWSPFDDINYWLYAGFGVGVTDGTLHFDLTPTGWNASAIPDDFTGGNFNGIGFVNGPGGGFWWDGVPANVMTRLPGTTDLDFGSLRPYRNFLIGMRTQITPAGATVEDLLRWSASADPGSVPSEWEPLPTNDAGSATVGEEAGEIVDGLTLRQSFIIYKQHSTWLLDFVGGQTTMTLRKLFNASGILARNCVVEARGLHYVLTDGDIIVHDGQTQRSLIEKRTRAFLFDTVDPENYINSFVVYNKKQGEVWFCFPTLQNVYCNFAMIYSIDDDAWGSRAISPASLMRVGNIGTGALDDPWEDDTNPWSSDTTTWLQSFFSGADFNLIQADSDQDRFLAMDGSATADGEPIVCSMVKLTMDLGNASEIKLVRRIWPFIDALAGTEILVRIGTQMFESDAVSWTPTTTYTVGEDLSVDIMASGRWISFELSTRENQIWRASGWDVEYEIQGRY